MSLRRSASFLSTFSGDIYWKVPTIIFFCGQRCNIARSESEHDSLQLRRLALSPARSPSVWRRSWWHDAGLQLAMQHAAAMRFLQTPHISVPALRRLLKRQRPFAKTVSQPLALDGLATGRES